MEYSKLITIDKWLEDFSSDLNKIEQFCNRQESRILQEKDIYGFASGHQFFGLHRDGEVIKFREWLPNATAVTIYGDFCNWDKSRGIPCIALGNGVWEATFHEELQHQSLYAMDVEWEGGSGKRIPAWSTRVVQDNNTHIFNAQAWLPPQEYQWKNSSPRNREEAPIIYEAHIGMGGEEERVHTYNEFRVNILPRIKKAGYNTLQFMAIQEHPYYGSFGYHVSSMFAATSRCGTPEELKQLIDEAHGMGISVIMDIVHSHAVKNDNEGLGNLDGTRTQFFHDGDRGDHPAWDSYCFNYNSPNVVHFLLSNIRFWLEEYQFDGFRFDGVTSMLYLDHGLGKAFTGYGDYFSPNLDYEAVTYLYLANKLIHAVNPNAISIAEEMSALPGLATPIEDGGIGFDYRMSMGVPDYWIKLIKEVQDNDWSVGDIFFQLKSHRVEEKVISYVESHDQALVGDKTLFFSLVEKEIYTSMEKDKPNLIIERGVALHKMIRLITATTAYGSYLNFMGNEFGHPEWIDFPREGNDWSYKHARRLWSISDNRELRFDFLQNFDRTMVALLKRYNLLNLPDAEWMTDNKEDQVLVYKRGELIFVFNFNPEKSFEGYGVEVGDEDSGSYRTVMTTDSHPFGGFNRIDTSITHYTYKNFLRLYIPARSAIILERVKK